MEIKKDILKQLKALGKSKGWDKIYEIATLNGHPVYELRNSSIPDGAKVGYPHLYSINRYGSLFELSTSQIHELIVLKQLLRKEIK